MGFVMVQPAQKLRDQGCLCECHGQGAWAATQAELLGGDVPKPPPWELRAFASLFVHWSECHTPLFA